MNRKHIRNIGIIAHIDAGKTTVTERILYYSGESHSYGDVHKGNTRTDFTAEEKAHGITIFSAATSVLWKNHKLNIIDTPGHIEFNVEVARSLRVLDGAVVVFDAVAGVEPQTESNWRLADKYGIPRICFVNKLDRVGADLFNTVKAIENRLGVDALVLQLPIGREADFTGIVDIVTQKAVVWHSDDVESSFSIQAVPESLMDTVRLFRRKLVETVVQLDDEAMDAYINGEPIDEAVLRKCIRRGTLGGDFVPVLGGSAYKNKGIQPLMDAVVDYLPSPGDLGAFEARLPDNNEPIDIARNDDGPFTALAFKIVNDVHGSLTFVRVYSGRKYRGDNVVNSQNGKKERLGGIFEMHAEKKVQIDTLGAGDIVAVTGLKHTKTGDTLCDVKRPVVLEKIDVPEPVIGMVIEAKHKQDQERMMKILKSFVDEDPSLNLNQDRETGQMIFSGMGELHLAMRLERLRSEYRLEARMGNPQVAYRETLTEKVKVAYLHKKQSGGPGQYAEVELVLEPLPRGTGIEFDTDIVGGVIPREYIPSVEKGIRLAAESGIVAGFPVVDFRAVLVGGSFHEQDSSTRAFEFAAMSCFRKGALAAKPRLLEPIMAVEISTPLEFVGDCIGDINRRRGMIREQTSNRSSQVLAVHAPLSELFGYVSDLRAITSGRANFAMQFDHYDPVPEALAEGIAAK